MTLLFTTFGSALMAEILDKTQIIALILAICYPWRKIVLGICLASLTNHLILIYLGFRAYSSIILPNYILYECAKDGFGEIPHDFRLLISIFVLILCGFVILSPKIEEQFSSNSPMIVSFIVFIIFLLGGLGGNTQITTLMISFRNGYSGFTILVGTLLGMLLIVGVWVHLGTLLRENLSPKPLKKVLGILFMFLCVLSFICY